MTAVFSNTPAVSKRWILALISLPIFIGALDLTVVSAVLPQVIFDLEIPIQTGLDEAAWIVTGYLLAYSVAMTFMGRLSDLYGRRRIFLLALAIFAFGSYLVAVADGWPTQLMLRAYYLLASGRPDPARVGLLALIGARMIQAFGGGAMVPVGMALVGDIYPAGERSRPLGFIAAVDTAGWVVGHLYGGIIVRTFNWRLIFWLNLPACLIAFLLIVFALRGLPFPRVRGRMDWLGAALIAASLTFINLGLGSPEAGGALTSAGDTAAVDLAQLGAGAMLLFIFIGWQARSRSPLIPLGLFRRPNFTPAAGANFLIGFSLFIAIANVPLFINTLMVNNLEQGAWESGWMLSALTVPMALTAVPGGWWTARRGYRWPGVAGILLALAGFGLMSTWRATTTYGEMVPHLVLTGIGFGLTLAPIATAAVDAAPDTDRGIASGLVIILRLVGLRIGVSSITTFGLHRTGVLYEQMLSPSMTLAETVQAVVRAAEIVIDESFLIAGAVCAAALIPTALLARAPANGLKGGHDDGRAGF
ncbi:MAG: MFS transporter [Anaerolineales bacterium]